MEKLKEDWSEFLKEQQVLKEEVDEEHAKAVGELGTRFSEKKKDLAQYSFIWAVWKGCVCVKTAPSLYEEVTTGVDICFLLVWGFQLEKNSRELLATNMG